MSLSKNELLDLLNHGTESIARKEPEGHRQLRTGRLENQPGTAGTYFGALDIAHGMLRDFAMYVVYPVLVVHREKEDSDLTRTLIREMFPTVLNYLGYSGFPELKRLGHQVLAASERLDRNGLDQALAALLRYVNTLYAWAYHYFPWKVGDSMRYESSPSVVSRRCIDASDSVEPTETLIRLRWEPLGFEVKAFLAMDLNTQLCEELLAALPFTCLQSHAMVSGQSIFAWTPLTTTAPTPFKEEIRTAPVGRLRFSARTGQKLIVQYGVTSEDIFAPVLGAVLECDKHLLPAIGAAVWQSTYETKEEVWLTVERC